LEDCKDGATQNVDATKNCEANLTMIFIYMRP